MNKIIDNVIDMIGDKKIITVAETHHFSYTSHTFQYKLVKKLIRTNKINAVSSERMGIIDALIINLFLNGKLVMTLEELYDSIPVGGIGTYRTIKFLKKNKQYKVKVIGVEADDYRTLYKDSMKKILKNICSIDFFNRINFNGDSVKNSKKFIKNKYDTIIYKALNLTHKLKNNYFDNRYKIWYQSMENIIDKYGNLFINGYHLGNDELGGELKNKYLNKVITIGMGSKNKFTKIAILPKNYLLKNKIEKLSYENISKDFIEFFIQEWKTKKIDKIIIDNLSKYVKPSKLEKKYNYYYILNTADEDGFILRWGAIPFPHIKGTDLMEIGGMTSVKIYDYIVFIPKSNFNENLHT